MARIRWRVAMNGEATMAEALTQVRRCPYCSIANPRLDLVWASSGPTPRNDGGDPEYWGAFQCSSCGSLVLAAAHDAGSSGEYTDTDSILPNVRTAHADLPKAARTYLQQAYETLHAPDASAVMAASAVDAMLRARGYEEGSLYARIQTALEENVLTKDMATWAHSVRLEANNVRHANSQKPHISPDEARQVVAFADALGSFMFVLSARVRRGIEASKEVSKSDQKRGSESS